MCRTDGKVYYTSNGNISINKSKLNKDTMEELAKSSATQLDVYYVRKEVSKIQKIFEAHIQDNNEWRDLMKKSLTVETVNGKTKTWTLAELALNNYENLRLMRDLNKLYEIMIRHKVLLFITFSIILAFHNNIVQILSDAVKLVKDLIP